MVHNKIRRTFLKMILPKVKDVMIEDVTTLDVSASLMDALQTVMKDGVNCVVFTRDGKPAGIITRRDLLGKCFFEKDYFEKMTVDKIMSQPLITIGRNEDVLEAYELMTQKGIRRLVVIEDGKVIGRIRRDEIRHMASETPATVLYRVGYFILGVLATIGVAAIILAL